MKKKRWIPVLLAVLVLIGGLYYTRPMTFDQLCPKLDRVNPGPLAGLYAVRETHPNGKVDSFSGTIALQKNDPLIAELFQILDSYTYRRSLTSLLPRFDTAFRDVSEWYIHIRTENGDLYQLYPDSNKLVVECEGAFYCRARANQPKAFEQAVYNFLMEHGA